MQTIECHGHKDIAPLYRLTEERAREIAHHLITEGGASWPVIYTASLFYECRLDFDELGQDFISVVLEFDRLLP